MVHVFHHLMHDQGNLLQQLLGSKAGLVALPQSGLDLVLNGSHPDHGELVQVGTADGNKTSPLQQRVGSVMSLLQDPFIKFQGTQFPVNK